MGGFDDWINELREDVVQGEYGYEEGEFSVYPDLWRPLFDEGLTPKQAFCRALGAHAEARREEDRAREENWRRIQDADRAAVSRETRE